MTRKIYGERKKEKHTFGPQNLELKIDLVQPVGRNKALAKARQLKSDFGSRFYGNDTRKYESALVEKGSSSH